MLVWIAVIAFFGLLGWLYAASALAERRNRREGSLSELPSFLSCLRQGLQGEDFVVVELHEEKGLFQFLFGKPNDVNKEFNPEWGPAFILDYPLVNETNARRERNFRSLLDERGLLAEPAPSSDYPDALQVAISEDVQEAAATSVQLFEKLFEGFETSLVNYRWSLDAAPEPRLEPPGRVDRECKTFDTNL